MLFVKAVVSIVEPMVTAVCPVGFTALMVIPGKILEKLFVAELAVTPSTVMFASVPSVTTVPVPAVRPPLVGSAGWPVAVTLTDGKKLFEAPEDA